MKTVLITGATGQDASCLTKILLDKGNYDVHLTKRHSSTNKNEYRIKHYLNKVTIHDMDLRDIDTINRTLKEVGPDIIFNLAAQSHVGVSFKEREVTRDINSGGYYRIMNYLYDNKLKNVKVYQASTSELYGLTPPKQNESSLMLPTSPYALAKLEAYNMVHYYRRFGYKTYQGLLFNHEQPGIRGEDFVTRKIAIYVADFKRALDNNKPLPILKLGCLDTKRDWGLASEYCEVMLRLIEELDPTDLVIGSGEMHTVKELLDESIRIANIQDHIIKPYIEIDQTLIRDGEVPELCADITLAKKLLGWEPKVKFKELVKLMVEAEINKPFSV